MAEAAGKIPVQVCYARPGRPLVLELTVAEGSSLLQAILVSGILQQVAELDLASVRVGVYGKLKPLESIVHAHDRIEIYRPLTADPKDSRRRRAGAKR